MALALHLLMAIHKRIYNIQYLVNIIISATLAYFSPRKPTSYATYKLWLYDSIYFEFPSWFFTNIKSIILVTLKEHLRHKQIGNVAIFWVIYHLGLPVLCNDNHFPWMKLIISNPVRVNINIIKLRRYNVLTQESRCNLSMVKFRNHRE
jgi:hypothetical protein